MRKSLKILFGRTKTKQFSETGSKIVFDADLSQQMYKKINEKKRSFIIEKDSKKYRLKQI